MRSLLLKVVAAAETRHVRLPDVGRTARAGLADQLVLTRNHIV